MDNANNTYHALKRRLLAAESGSSAAHAGKKKWKHIMISLLKAVFLLCA